MNAADEQPTPYYTVLSRRLAARGLVRSWAERTELLKEVVFECQALSSIDNFPSDMAAYLRNHEIVRQSFDMVISHLAMAANVRWQDLPPPFQPYAVRGWHIGRWLPTFLLIDGPLGNLLRSADSPLSDVLNKRHKDFPLLADARAAFRHDFFRRVRNGFAHWSFHWRDHGDGSSITIIEPNHRNGLKIDLLEAEALHFMSYLVVESLDNHVVRAYAS